MISYLSKKLNPIWIEGVSIKELVLAYSLYPTKSEVKNKFLNGILFYISFVTTYTGFISHGWFVNHHNCSPTLSKIFASHLNLPYSFKLFRVIALLGIVEILFVHLYSLFLYFKRNEQFEKMFRLEPLVDQNFRRKLLKVNEVMGPINAISAIIVSAVFYCYGWESTDLTGKLIAFIWFILTIPYLRFLTCLLYLLYTYMILTAQLVKKVSSNTVALCQMFRDSSGTLNDCSVNIFRLRYNFIVNTISQTQGLISTLSALCSILALPLTSLSWLLLINSSGTIFLGIFKWYFVPIAVFFGSRTYVFNIYFSRIHSESKKLHSTLNSLIARRKVRNDGKKILLFIAENISGRNNRMAYRDSIGSLVEQMDVLTSILRTLELLLLGLSFRKNALA